MGNGTPSLEPVQTPLSSPSLSLPIRVTLTDKRKQERIPTPHQSLDQNRREENGDPHFQL